MRAPITFAPPPANPLPYCWRCMIPFPLGWAKQPDATGCLNAPLCDEHDASERERMRAEESPPQADLFAALAQRTAA